MSSSEKLLERLREPNRDDRTRSVMNNRYEIVVCWSGPDDCFLAEVPELPHLITDGETRQEALRNAELMIDAYLETARRESWPVPPPQGRLAFG